MKLLTKLFFLLAIAATVTTGCSDDDELDQTSVVVGTYLGDYSEGDASGSLEFEDVEVRVTSTSGSTINVRMIVIPGLAEMDFPATMDSETEFTISEVSLPDNNVQGTGSINDNTININLNDVDDPAYQISYTGTRQ